MPAAPLDVLARHLRDAERDAAHLAEDPHAAPLARLRARDARTLRAWIAARA